MWKSKLTKDKFLKNQKTIKQLWLTKKKLSKSKKNNRTKKYFKKKKKISNLKQDQNIRLN